MITPDELYMYQLPEIERAKIVQILREQGYHIRWDQTIITNTDGLTYLESKGMWYDATHLKTCACCGKKYLVQEEPKAVTVWSEEEEDDISFCSEVCLKDGGYVKTVEGEIIYAPESGQRSKANYKSSTKVSEATEEHPFLIGLEIEKEDQASYDKMYNTEEGLKSPKGWLYVHDGSLKSDCGLELVSHGYNLTKEKKEMLAAIDSCADFINGTSSSRCGGHISVSEYGKTSEELAEELRPLVCFMLALFPNRMRNNKINKLNFNQCLSNPNEKYKPLMLSPNGRVELRMISRVKSVNSLKRRIDIIQWFLENKPTFKQTKQSMKDGYLKDVMSAVYGTESWDDKISIFNKMSLWFCWNINSLAIDSIMENDS